jgi:DNA repair protein RadC
MTAHDETRAQYKATGVYGYDKPPTMTAEDKETLDRALAIIRSKYIRGPALTSPEFVADYLKRQNANLEHEVFGAVWLDNQHRVLYEEVLFRGTIDAANAYPREVVKAALAHNTAAVILYHNHPSGEPEPSQADRMLTERLQKALELVGVRVLDHIITGGAEHVSFARRHLL